MRALIVTIRDNGFNYGNKLQNYAVMKILEKYNYKAKTLCFESKKRKDRITFLKFLFHRCTNYRLVRNKKYWSEYQVFRKFDSKNIPAVYYEKPDDIRGYDLYVIGSDQVWNAKWYKYNPIRKDFYLLNFDKKVKKLCMAPSFGIDELPNEWKEFFKSRLLEFSNLSVREEKGAEIIRELTGQIATVLVDPTMLLTKNEWEKIAKKPLGIDANKAYILTYFLGGRNQRVNSEIENIANKHELKVYNLMDQETSELWSVGPSEFVYLVSNASLIMTDSFHASVFSFLFKKPFLVYPRSGAETDMLSRIYTLLDKFEILDRFVENELPENIFDSNYDVGYSKLEFERIKAWQFIEKTLDN